MAVNAIFSEFGFKPLHIDLGIVKLADDISVNDKQIINDSLKKIGLEIIDYRKAILVEQIKRIIIELVWQRGDNGEKRISKILTQSLHFEYNYLSSLFSSVVGTSIERYFILQKVERVKELLIYGEYTLSEISYELNYSSVAHLSAQFKKITGLTPSAFKREYRGVRFPIDDLLVHVNMKDSFS